MAELSKQALKVQNNTEFPNNNAGLITPTKLRGFNVDMIDSLVDEISYNVDSASWNQQIDSLENFTASLATNFVTTGSFNSYTQSTDNRLNNLESTSASVNISIANLNAYTASDDTSISNLEAFTASAAVSISNLNQSSASQQISIDALNAFSASQIIVDNAFNVAITNLNSFTQSAGVSLTNLNSATASLFTSASLGLTTASFDNGNRNLTFSKGDGTTFAVNIPDVSGSAGNFVTTSSFNAYTQSNDQRVGSLEANSGSVNTSITNINSATQSLFTSASLGLTTASVSLNTITFSKGDGSTFNLTVDTGSGQAVPAGTISGSAQITALGFVSSSVTASSLVTASISGQLLTFTKGNGTQFNLTLPTGSGGGQAVTASYGAFSDTTTQSGSANVAYPFKFDTVDIVDGVTLSGSTGLQVNSTGVYNIQFSAQGVQGAGAGIGNIWFRQNGLDIPNSDTQFTIPSNQKFVAAWNIFATASAGDNFQIIWRSDSANTTWAFITGSGTSPNSPSIIATVNRVDVGGGGATDTGSLLVTASFFNNVNLRFTKGDGSTFDVPGVVSTGSSTITGTLTFDQDTNAGISYPMSGGASIRIQKQVGINRLAWVDENNEKLLYLDLDTDQFYVSGGFSAGLQQGYAWVGDTTNRAVPVATSSFAGGGGGTTYENPTLNPYSGSLILAANTTTTSSFSHITASNNGQVNLIFQNRNLTGQIYITGSSNIFSNPNAPAAGRLNYLGGSSNILLTSFTANNTQAFPTMTGSAATIGGVYPAMNGNILMGQSAWTINPSNNPGIHNYNNNILNGSTTFNTVGNVQTAGVANSGRIEFTGNTTAGNITINSPSRSLAEIAAGATGSMRLSIQNNNVQGTFTYNGPISGSPTTNIHQINQNSVAGNLTLNIQSGSKGYTISQNSINGTLTYNDNVAFTPTLGSAPSIINNVINGNVTANTRNSASLNLSNNNINTWTISSDLDASAVTTATARSATLGGNGLFGTIGNNILFSGSSTGTTTKAISNNLMAGSNISASVGGGEQALTSTAVLGNGLHVFGTSLLNGSNQGVAGERNGSLFAGRWNSLEGTCGFTAETVFAVGTGTSGSAGIVRKTGFLIDSGSNTFVEGTLNVSGSTSFTGSAPSILSSSFSGSLITNLTDVYTDVSAVNQIVTLTSASYAGLVSGSLTNPNTLYIVSGSTQVNPAFPYTGSAVITGSLTITGSAIGNVVSMSISSNTASMDLSAGNYFELTSSVTPLRIELSNLKGGVTSTLIISASASSSITFSSNVAQPSGSAYSGSAGSIDILSFVAFNTSKVNVVSTKALV